jgi:O-acetyl-ADP-ribose deacetylase (regulator of RNase III)
MDGRDVSDDTIVQIGTTRVEIVSEGLLATNAPAIMLSANNGLRANPTRPSRSRDVEQRAGPAYHEECARLSRSVGLEGLKTGTAVVMGSGDLGQNGPIRWIIQAVTIHYDQNKKRTPATPEIVYRAVRAGLEKAETYRIDTVATYLITIRPDYRTAPADDMAEALFRAVLDHAAIASSVQLIRICEPDLANYQMAQRVLCNVAR